MTDPITREQVERAIDQAVTDHFVIMPMHFGGDAWRDAIPDHVRSGYDVSFDALVRALTRWRDELVAAETPRKVARWDARVGVYALNPLYAHDSDLDGLGVQRSATRGEAIAWGYTIEGGPEWDSIVVIAESQEAAFEPVDKAAALEPASPPAPEVADVPQPVVKRCACPDIHDDVEAEWRPGEPYLTVTHTTVPLALLRAMLEAIDAQQGGAS